MKCIFLGYVDDDFGYRLWDIIKNKVIRSRDVIFNELEMFKKSEVNMEVKKVVDRSVEQKIDILPLQENGKHIQEKVKQQMEHNEKKQE